MNPTALVKNKIVVSFVAAFVVSTFLYVFVRHGQLYPVPFYLKPCTPSGIDNVCNVSDTTSLIALYVNIIFVWFIFFFFYICCSIYEIFKNYDKYKNAPSNK